jgi:predicted alpha/beta-hydrolase family hydrolase
MEAQRLFFDVAGSGPVSGLLLQPSAARACYVLAHGAGAGMTHPFLDAIAKGLARRGMATFRYQFPYMEKRGRRPDPPKLAEAAVRAAVAEAARLLPDLPLIAGGKSFGGRMTSQAQAREPLPGVRGLAFLGFPLHPPGKPSTTRAEHLADVRVPMLFIQGTRDEFAALDLLRLECAKLTGVTLHLVDDADHSFRVPARTGRKDADVRAEMEEVFVRWAARILAATPRDQ